MVQTINGIKLATNVIIVDTLDQVLDSRVLWITSEDKLRLLFSVTLVSHLRCLRDLQRTYQACTHRPR